MRRGEERREEERREEKRIGIYKEGERISPSICSPH